MNFEILMHDFNLQKQYHVSNIESLTVHNYKKFSDVKFSIQHLTTERKS